METAHQDGVRLSKRRRLLERVKLLAAYDGLWGWQQRDAVCEILTELIAELKE